MKFSPFVFLVLLLGLTATSAHGADDARWGNLLARPEMQTPAPSGRIVLKLDPAAGPDHGRHRPRRTRRRRRPPAPVGRRPRASRAPRAADEPLGGRHDSPRRARRAAQRTARARPQPLGPLRRRHPRPRPPRRHGRAARRGPRRPDGLRRTRGRPRRARLRRLHRRHALAAVAPSRAGPGPADAELRQPARLPECRAGRHRRPGGRRELPARAAPP